MGYTKKMELIINMNNMKKNELCILSQSSYQKILDYEKQYNSNKKMTFYINRS